MVTLQSSESWLDHRRLLSSSTEIHTSVRFLILVLLTLVQVKYQDKQDSPFETHEAIMVLFIVAAFIYTVSFLSSLILIQNHHDYTFYVLPILKQISVVSGTLACDSLILILCPPFGYLVLALCALLALRILIGSYHQIVHCSKRLRVAFPDTPSAIQQYYTCLVAFNTPFASSVSFSSV
ncbi:hypothetical protein MANES_01G269250v8 [Manihot esculenta]|uniref:Uncharacterized protein n=1 Tax=Manihot esculenta TaxID=3983 RepID=A0ACB7IHN7_MANES|nr:hypothetical protein MANES_01G269250v8 [Manihot esculenta]